MVIDTSVLLKYFFDEEGSDLARGLILQGDLVAPDLLIYECINILTLTRVLSLTEIEEYIRKLYELGIQIFILPESSFLKVARCSREYGITSYDASFVILAEVLQTDLITADRRLVSKTKTLRYIKLLQEEEMENLQET